MLRKPSDSGLNPEVPLDRTPPRLGSHLSCPAHLALDPGHRRFVYGFIAWTGWASLLRWNGLLPLQAVPGLPELKVLPPKAPFVQLDNYIRLIRSDQRFQQDVENTVVFTVLFIIACLGFGLLLAVLLDQRIRGEGLFRGIYLFPMSVSFIVTGVVWRWVLNPGTEQTGALGVKRSSSSATSRSRSST